MPRMTFQSASRLWLELADVSESSTPDRDEAYLAAEQTILDRRPRDDGEAMLIAEVLAESIAGGERSDGRDVTALRNLQVWIGRSLSRDRVPAAARSQFRETAQSAVAMGG